MYIAINGYTCILSAAHHLQVGGLQIGKIDTKWLNYKLNMQKYYLIHLKDGRKLKTPVEETTEENIRNYFGDILLTLDIGYVGSNIKNDPKNYWKVRMDYSDDTNDLVIDEVDIVKVMFAFIKQQNVVTSQGAIRGKDIISIIPDFVTSYGWNRGYIPTPEEWSELNSSDNSKKLRDLTSKIKTCCVEAKTKEEAIVLLEQMDKREAALLEL